MKAFIKLLITILVVAVIGYIVGYLLMNGAKEKKEISSGESLDNEIVTNSGEEVFGEILDTISGDAEEFIPNENEEPIISKEERIRMIDEKVESIRNSGDVMITKDDKLTLDLASDSAKEMMNYFKANELTVSVNVKSGMIEIIPYTDFVQNMVYFFDENGDLILYESVSTTVGGSCKYYFYQGKGVSVIVDYEEDVEVKEEYIGDVLTRAKLIYDKYMIQ